MSKHIVNMGQEAITHHTEEIKKRLGRCRAGNILRNGYSLWVSADILENEGESLDKHGTTRVEVRDFLVSDLHIWLKFINKERRPSIIDLLDISIIAAYFQNPEKDSLEDGILDRLEITGPEIEQMMHNVEVRMAKEELKICRENGPSQNFWGLKGSLLTNSIRLDEIGATAEEIERYTATYRQQHPRSNWDSFAKQLQS